MPFSPLPWFPLFCGPQGLGSSPSSLPPGLLRVCAGGPDWTLARLRLTFTILGLERWHILVLHHRKGSRTHVGEKVHKCEFNPSEICFHTWFGLCGFTAQVWAFKSQPTCFCVCRFPSGSCSIILLLLLPLSFCTKPVCHGTGFMKWTSSQFLLHVKFVWRHFYSFCFYTYKMMLQEDVKRHTGKLKKRLLQFWRTVKQFVIHKEIDHWFIYFYNFEKKSMFTEAKTLRNWSQWRWFNTFFNKSETPLTWSKLYSHLVVKWENARLKLLLFGLQ